MVMIILEEFQKRVYKTSIEHGFNEENVDQKLLLAVGEIVEAQNTIREGHRPTSTWLEKSKDGSFKPEGFGIEIADAIIRLLNILSGQGIDATEVLLAKAHYNDQRPFKHGKAF